MYNTASLNAVLFYISLYLGAVLINVDVLLVLNLT